MDLENDKNRYDDFCNQHIFLLGCLTVKYDLFKLVNAYLFRKKLNKKCIYSSSC